MSYLLSLFTDQKSLVFVTILGCVIAGGSWVTKWILYPIQVHMDYIETDIVNIRQNIDSIQKLAISNERKIDVIQAQNTGISNLLNRIQNQLQQDAKSNQ